MENKLQFGGGTPAQPYYKWYRYNFTCSKDEAAVLDSHNPRSTFFGQYYEADLNQFQITSDYQMKWKEHPQYRTVNLYYETAGQYLRANKVYTTTYPPDGVALTNESFYLRDTNMRREQDSTSSRIFLNVCWFFHASTKTNIQDEEDLYPHDDFALDSDLRGYYYDLYDEPHPYIPPEEIDDSQLYGGVRYDCTINNKDDLTIGTTATAKIVFTIDRSLAKGTELTYLIRQRNDGANWRTIGKFYVDSSDKQGNRYRITALDAVSKFNINIDNWLAGITFPTTLGAFYGSLCTYCGVTPVSTTFTNSTIQVSNSFATKNVTGRPILGYIAEAAGGFAKANSDGNIQIAQLSSSSTITIDNSKFVTAEVADFAAPVIDTVWCGFDDNDVGVQVGTGNVPLKIYYNPMLADKEQSALATYLTNILNVVRNYSYTPATIDMLEDYNIQVGDRVRFTDTRTSTDVYVYVFTKSMNLSGTTIECSGNPVREEEITSENSEILRLKGRYNVLTNTVTEHTREIGDLGNSVTTISQTAEGLTVDVHDLQTDMTNTLTFNNQGLIVKHDGTQTTINGGNIDADSLNLHGRITFDDMSTSTVRKLGNILRQNTIPTGSDLEEGLLWLNTGNDITIGGVTYYANGWYSYDGSAWIQISNPFYIRSTYIDSAEIVTPTLRGNNIIVEGDSGGCFQVRRQGQATGYVGVGSDYDFGSRQVQYGVVVADDQNGNTYLDEGDYFLMITANNARLQAGNYAIFIDSTGAYYRNNLGENIPLGYATFA